MDPAGVLVHYDTKVSEFCALTNRSRGTKQALSELKFTVVMGRKMGIPSLINRNSCLWTSKLRKMNNRGDRRRRLAKVLIIRYAMGEYDC